MMTDPSCAGNGRFHWIFLEIVQLHNQFEYNHLSSCWEIETVGIGHVSHLKSQKNRKKKEHRSMTLIRDNRHPLLLTADIRYKELRLSQCAGVVFTTSSGCLMYPSATLAVIHSIASCLSPKTVVSNFSPSWQIVWDQHPSVCLSIFLYAHAQHTCCCKKYSVMYTLKPMKCF